MPSDKHRRLPSYGKNTRAKAMGYINYPDIKPPTKSKQNMQTSMKTATN